MTGSTGLGATLLGNGDCRFVVWAPKVKCVEVQIGDPPTRTMSLAQGERGYHEGTVAGVGPGERYRFQLDGRFARPDPASHWQPNGVHGPSAVVDPSFGWTDEGWRGIPLERYVIYELHVGTFTEEGTFGGVERHLASLRDLGVTAIELMPVAQFPGARNWGYDGVFPFAVQDSYGGAEGLKRLVNAAHAAGLAVILDVVYNHLGPEGNYLSDFGPYFTSRYQTPWGAALNFDGPDSDEVRRFFIENALQWVDEFHFDALRLDAVHAIADNSAHPFLRELADAVHVRARALRRQVFVIAETDANDVRVCGSAELGGLGYDGQWSDDLHHALHAFMTGERGGYYADFGSLDQVVSGLREGFIFQGQYSPFRRRRHGSVPKGLPPSRFVVCSQNHDQVGNRMMGDRLSASISFEASKLVAGAVILSPYIPLLFMGEEYGETAPFQYFVDHSDPGLIDAVRRGRREEFSAFAWKGKPPDPQDAATFRRSRLNHSLAENGRHAALRDYYRELLRLRSVTSVLMPTEGTAHDVRVVDGTSVIMLTRRRGVEKAIVLMNFADVEGAVSLGHIGGRWSISMNSAAARWGGPDADDVVSDNIGSLQEVQLSPHSLKLLVDREGA